MVRRRATILTSMPERRPPVSPSSSRGGPVDDETKGKTARTLPLGSVQAEVRARTAVTQSPFPDREETVKRPYPHWDEATAGAPHEQHDGAEDSRDGLDTPHGLPAPPAAPAGPLPRPATRPGRTLLMPGAGGPPLPAARPGIARGRAGASPPAGTHEAIAGIRAQLRQRGALHVPAMSCASVARRPARNPMNRCRPAACSCNSTIATCRRRFRLPVTKCPRGVRGACAPLSCSAL